MDYTHEQAYSFVDAFSFMSPSLDDYSECDYLLLVNKIDTLVADSCALGHLLFLWALSGTTKRKTHRTQ